MRQLLRDFAFAGLVLLSAACSTASTEVATNQDATDAAAQFERLANDALAAGADAGVVSAYREIGRTVGMHGRVSPVTIVVDGVPQEFLATARQLEFAGGPQCGLATLPCPVMPPMRSVIAWQRSDPRRVVQLTGSATSAIIGPMPELTPAVGYVPPATLAFFDGTGGFYVGTSGTHRIGDPVTSATPCQETRVSATAAMPSLGQCTVAEFTASFSGTVAPAPMFIRKNTASGTHTISMTSQSIQGARIVLSPVVVIICPTCDGGYPRELLPPIGLPNGAMRANVTAVASAAEVTFMLSVTNTLTVPATLQFTSGQEFDFQVFRADGVPVWTWSANKAFTQALGSRTLAAGETVIYGANWTPTVKGELTVVGRLVSSSHAAQSNARFVVP